MLLPTSVDPAAISDTCTVVTAIALVTGTFASFVDADGEHRDLTLPYTSIGVPVPCRW